MFEQVFKNIFNTLRKDAGCSSELDYIEQTTWILFLKYLDDLERDRATAAELTGKAYTPLASCIFTKRPLWPQYLQFAICNLIFDILPSSLGRKSRWGLGLMQ